MRTWYNLKADDKKATVSIFDAIGEFGVSAKSFLNDLRGVKASDIDVEINSPGGDVFAGIAIYNGLRQSGKKINVKIMGVAASAASLVAMAGDTIEMPSNTFMMIHNPWSFAMGNADDMRETADMLDKIGSSLVGTYATRTGKSEDEIKAMLNAETWMTAEEAVEAGFATKVIEAVAAKAEFDADRVPEHVKAVLNAVADSQPAEPDPEDEKHQDSSVADAAPVATFADQVMDLASRAGFSAYAAHWALDPNMQDLTKVQARISECLEIKALAKVVNLEASADKLIRSGKSYAEARAALQNELAGDGPEIDTAPQNGKPPQSAQPSAIRFTDAWAKRV